MKRLGKKPPKNWKEMLVNTLATPGRFARGGDRTQARGAKQQAIVEYLEQQAEAAGPELGSDTVADDCIRDVAQRWQCPTPKERRCCIVRCDRW